MENPRYYADEAKAIRSLLIYERLEVLEKVIEEQRQIHAEFTQKLEPVIRQEPALAAGNLSRDKESNMSPLATRIENLRDRLAEVSAMYRALMNRVEL